LDGEATSRTGWKDTAWYTSPPEDETGMSIISAIDLGKAFGADDIFSHLSFSVRARIGLVGINGVGKTTLLRILMGLEEPSAGRVQRAKNLKVGYLAQEATLDTTRTLWEECLAVFEPLRERQRELHRLESLMSDPAQAESIIDTYGRLQHEFDHLGGYTYENRIRMTLMGVGFSSEDEKRPIPQLSGGQRTRACLARLLLSDPDLLLLDEPTNHLDIAAIEWLEAYLRDWAGSVLIVSHDRYFLDQVVSTIWEMTPALEVYHGNYSAYVNQRNERYESKLAEFKAQQGFIQKEEDYIRRNIAGQNTHQARGRRTRLERMMEESLLTPPRQARRLSLRLAPAGRSGDLVLRTYGLSIGYADEGRALFHVPDLVLRRGECAAILGPNGAGKTTFLKTLLEQIPPYGGEVSPGASLKIGYFAQAHELLHPDWTLMQEIDAIGSKMLPAEVRDYLARFLFTGDDVFRTVDTLSGGERGRLALACLSLTGYNLLLLDEPTNHLDLPSQEVLQSILADFPGTILLVSHDRYLIDALATQIWEVLPDERTLRPFDGTYSEYKAASQVETATPMVKTVQVEKPRQTPSQSGAPSKQQLHRRQVRREELEKRITELEQQIEATGRQLENPPADPAKVQLLGQDYNDLQAILDKHLDEWGELA
jgi:ATP-binding cassette subfamily F protein 3